MMTGAYRNALAIDEGGDVVRVGHFQLQFVEDEQSLASALADADADFTTVVEPPQSRAGSTSSLESSEEDDEEYTRVVRPPAKRSGPVRLPVASDEYTRVAQPEEQKTPETVIQSVPDSPATPDSNAAFVFAHVTALVLVTAAAVAALRETAVHR